MADTARTIAAMASLLADNSSGAISAQDIRDLMETLHPGHGELYVSSASATSFSDSTTYVPAAGTWTLSSGGHNWDESAGNGKLTYTGTPNRVCHIASSFSIISSANSQVIYTAIAKNGSNITPSIVSRKIGTGADVGAVALHATTTVSTGDYLTVQLRNSSWTSAQTVTLNEGNLFVMSMPTAT